MRLTEMKSKATGRVRQARRRKATGSPIIRYRRYLLNAEADKKEMNLAA